MSQKILLGVDGELSPATVRALRTAGELYEKAAPHFTLLLLNVIPITQATSTHPGVYVGQLVPSMAPTWQKKQAEEILTQARLLLQEQGVSPKHIEEQVRIGVPADEIAKIAYEQQVGMIVLGSRGESWRQTVRRFFIGSLSRRVMQLVSCPVTIVVPSRSMLPTTDLVNWYESAIMRYLREHKGTLAIFKPKHAATQFAPPEKPQVGEAEIKAATQALERLSCAGTLCRHQFENEVCYVND